MKKIFCLLGILCMSGVAVAQVPQLSFIQQSYTYEEGSQARISITTSRPVTQTTRVQLRFVPGTARPGTDYIVVSPIVTFYKNGLRTKSIIVPIRVDQATEGSENMSVVVQSVNNRPVAIASAPKTTLTIIDRGQSNVGTGGSGSTGGTGNVGGSGSTGSGAAGSGEYVWQSYGGPDFSPVPPLCTATPRVGATCSPSTDGTCRANGLTYQCARRTEIPLGSLVYGCMKPLESRNCDVDPNSIPARMQGRVVFQEFDNFNLKGKVQNLNGSRLNGVKVAIRVNQDIPGALLGGGSAVGQSDSNGEYNLSVKMPTGRSATYSGTQLTNPKNMDTIASDIMQKYFGVFADDQTRPLIIPGGVGLNLTHTTGNDFRIGGAVPFASVGPLAEYATRDVPLANIPADVKICTGGSPTPPTHPELARAWNAVTQASYNSQIPGVTHLMDSYTCSYADQYTLLRAWRPNLYNASNTPVWNPGLFPNSFFITDGTTFIRHTGSYPVWPQ